MNTLSKNAPQPLTMSSREIAKLTHKQPQHVKRDIEKMLAELHEDASKFGRIYLDSRNRQQTEYHLDRELTDTLLTGYSAVLRRKVIVRWRELEAAALEAPAAARLPYVTQPSDSLTEDEQDHLRSMLTEAVQKIPYPQRAAAMIKGWSKLKAHFGVKYRDIPSGEITEAISILGRHIADFEQEQIPVNQPLPVAHTVRQSEQLQLALGGIASLTESVASLAATVANLTGQRNAIEIPEQARRKLIERSASNSASSARKA